MDPFDLPPPGEQYTAPPSFDPFDPPELPPPGEQYTETPASAPSNNTWVDDPGYDGYDGYYRDSVSGQVWTGTSGWHDYDPSRKAASPPASPPYDPFAPPELPPQGEQYTPSNNTPWVGGEAGARVGDAFDPFAPPELPPPGEQYTPLPPNLTWVDEDYGNYQGYYRDAVSGQVWTGPLGWHDYDPSRKPSWDPQPLPPQGEQYTPDWQEPRLPPSAKLPFAAKGPLPFTEDWDKAHRSTSRDTNMPWDSVIPERLTNKIPNWGATRFTPGLRDVVKDATSPLSILTGFAGAPGAQTGVKAVGGALLKNAAINEASNIAALAGFKAAGELPDEAQLGGATPILAALLAGGGAEAGLRKGAGSLARAGGDALESPALAGLRNLPPDLPSPELRQGTPEYAARVSREAAEAPPPHDFNAPGVWDRGPALAPPGHVPSFEELLADAFPAESLSPPAPKVPKAPDPPEVPGAGVRVSTAAKTKDVVYIGKGADARAVGVVIKQDDGTWGGLYKSEVGETDIGTTFVNRLDAGKEVAARTLRAEAGNDFPSALPKPKAAEVAAPPGARALTPAESARATGVIAPERFTISQVWARNQPNPDASTLTLSQKRTGLYNAGLESTGPRVQVEARYADADARGVKLPQDAPPSALPDAIDIAGRRMPQRLAAAASPSGAPRSVVPDAKPLPVSKPAPVIYKAGDQVIDVRDGEIIKVTNVRHSTTGPKRAIYVEGMGPDGVKRRIMAGDIGEVKMSNKDPMQMTPAEVVRSPEIQDIVGGPHNVEARHSLYSGKNPDGTPVDPQVRESTLDVLRQEIIGRRAMAADDLVRANAIADPSYRLPTGQLKIEAEAAAVFGPLPRETALALDAANMNALVAAGAVPDPMIGTPKPAPRTHGKVATGTIRVVETLRVPQSLLLGGDLGMALRQARLAIVSWNPVQTAKATGQLFRAYVKGGQKFADDVMRAYHGSPIMEQVRRAGIFVAEIGSDDINLMEENVARRVVGKLWFYKNAERAQTVFMTTLRIEKLRTIIGNDPAKWAQFSDAEMRGWGAHINHWTGRGTGTWLDDNAATLNIGLISTRFYASKVQAFTDPFIGPGTMKIWSKSARRTAASDMVRAALMMGGLGGGLALAGKEVFWDPEHPLFGRVDIGGSKYNLLGGWQDPVKITMAIINAYENSKDTGWTEVQYQLSNKLNPAFRALWNKAGGPHFVPGQSGAEMLLNKLPIVPDSVTSAIANMAIPLFIQDVVEAWIAFGKDISAGSFGTAVVSSVGAFLGESPLPPGARDQQEAAFFRETGKTALEAPGEFRRYQNTHPLGSQDISGKSTTIDRRNDYAEVKRKTAEDQAESDKRLAAGDLSAKQWGIDRNLRLAKQRGQQEAIYRDAPDYKQTPTAVTRYFDAQEKATRADGTIDYDKLEELLGQNATQYPDDEAQMEIYFNESPGTAAEKSKKAVQAKLSVKDAAGVSFWDFKDETWRQFADLHPELASYPDYYAWRDALSQQEYARLVANGADVSTIERQLDIRRMADEAMQKDKRIKEFNDALHSLYVRDWVVANPQLAQDAYGWDLFDPRAAEKKAFPSRGGNTSVIEGEKAKEAAQKALTDAGFDAFPATGKTTGKTSTNPAWMAHIRANKGLMESAIKDGGLTLDSGAEWAAVGITKAQYDAWRAYYKENHPE